MRVLQLAVIALSFALGYGLDTGVSVAQAGCNGHNAGFDVNGCGTPKPIVQAGVDCTAEDMADNTDATPGYVKGTDWDVSDLEVYPETGEPWIIYFDIDLSCGTINNPSDDCCGDSGETCLTENPNRPHLKVSEESTTKFRVWVNKFGH